MTTQKWRSPRRALAALVAVTSQPAVHNEASQRTAFCCQNNFQNTSQDPRAPALQACCMRALAPLPPKYPM